MKRYPYQDIYKPRKKRTKKKCHELIEEREEVEGEE